MKRIISVLIICSVNLTGCTPVSDPFDKFTVEFSPLLETYFALESLSATFRETNRSWELFKNNQALEQQPLHQILAEEFADEINSPIVLRTAQINDQLHAAGYGNEYLAGLFVSETEQSIVTRNCTEKYNQDISLATLSATLQEAICDYSKAMIPAARRMGLLAMIEDQAEFYAGGVAEIRHHVDPSSILAMEAFYGESRDRYVAVTSPMMAWPIEENEGRGIGGVAVSDGVNLTYSIMSPYVPIDPSQGESHGFGYDHAFRANTLTVHEFSHAFVNPAVALHSEWFDRNEKLFNANRLEIMSTKGVGDLQTFIAETLIRIGEIRIAEATGQSDMAATLRDYHIREGFDLIPSLETMIIDYEGRRDIYPNFRAFLPVILDEIEANG